MIILIPFLLFLFFIFLWLFFKKTPTNANRKYLLIYNIGSIFLAILLSILFAFIQYKATLNTRDFGWAPFIAIISLASAFALGLFIAFLIRNLLFSQKKLIRYCTIICISLFIVITSSIFRVDLFNHKNNYGLKKEIIRLEKAEGWKLVYSNGTNLYNLSINGKSRSILNQKSNKYSSETHPSLSPDGTKIAFVADCEEKGTIRIQSCVILSSLDGNYQKEIAKSSGIKNILWSPDGNKIAFLNSLSDKKWRFIL